MWLLYILECLLSTYKSSLKSKSKRVKPWGKHLLNMAGREWAKDFDMCNEKYI